MKRSTVRRIAVWGLAVVTLAFVAWVVPIDDRCTDAGCEPGLRSVVARASAPLLAVLFVVYLTGSVLWAIRWRALLGIAEVDVGLAEVWRVTLEAQAGGILLPGGVAGDALRVAFVKSRGRGGEGQLAKIIASVFVDRVLGLATLATLAAGAAVLFGIGAAGASTYFAAVFAIPALAVLAWFTLRGVARARPTWLDGEGLVGRVGRPLFAYVGAAGGGAALARGAVASLGLSAIQLLVVRGLIAALGVTPTREAWVYVGSTLGAIVGALPLAPGSIGTADAAYAFFLGRAGVPASVAVSVCMLYRLYWYGTGLLGGMLALRRRGRARDEEVNEG